MKTVKKLAAAGVLLAFAAALCAVAYYFFATANVRLDPNKLAFSENYAEVFDREDVKAAEISLSGAEKKIRLAALPPCVKEAFLAAEDKKFYRHRGLDYARIAKAAVKNIGARSFRQGASTISQQLIKNTHLSNEKTLRRKMQEIRLTKKLERRFTKDEILEAYLNTIYFGHNCYGIAGAADYYFGKSAEELSAAEAATLAAVIRSPGKYSPFLHPENCLPARNAILKRMLALGYLRQEGFDAACGQALPQKGENTVSDRTYLQGIFAELEEIGALAPYRLLHGIRIYTYLDSELQNYIENLHTDADRSGKSIVIEDNASFGISAWYTTEGCIPRQPGSLLKPLAVYAPAIEENLISPATPVADERTDFDGYSPSNYKDIYRGYISVRQALAESVNIPAVKILARLGVEKSGQYLSAMGLSLRDEDKTLSLALGGLSEGFTLPAVTGAYALFANEGIYMPPAFIRKIESKNGELLYERENRARRIFSEDTVTLLNDMLRDAAKTGTAKKLASLPFPVCAKTGTCGSEEGNTDAYAVAYTKEHTVGVWMGNADNERTDITGGGLPCHYALLLERRLYAKKTPAPLTVSPRTENVRLDAIAYEKYHEVALAHPSEPKRYTFTELFRKSNLPQKAGTAFAAPHIDASVSVKEGAVYIDLCGAEYYDVIIKRENRGKSEAIYDGKARAFCDDTVRPGEKYLYAVIPYFIDDDGNKICGKEIALPAVRIGPSTKKSLPQPFADWWKK